MRRLTAGEIRQQSALSDSNNEVERIVITEDNHLKSLIDKAQAERAHIPHLTVGSLREAFARMETDKAIEIDVDDEDVKAYLDEAGLTIIPIGCYPDSTDRHGNPTRTFKIELIAVPKT